MTKTCLLLASCLVALPATSLAQRPWVEAKGPNVTVMSDAGEGRARDIAWQFEQVREAMARLFPWVRSRSSKPLVALAARDEATMRALVPEHFERRRNFILSSWSVIGVDRSYIALRADLRGDDREGVNPYENAFWGYAAQALSETAGTWPTWLRRGLASVISNTLVRDKEIQLGRVLPGHVTQLRTRGRLLLKDVVSVIENDDPRMKQDGFFDTLDAQAWALVHFLIWGDQGAHRPALDAYIRGLLDGADPVTSLAGTLGDVGRLESPFNVHINRDLFGYSRVETSAKVSRDGFVTRAVPPAEAALVQAAFHAAMGRPTEAQALVAEARKSDAAVGDEVVAIIADRENRDDDASMHFEKAVIQPLVSWYAPYRLATLLPVNLDEATRARIEGLLRRATELNPNADDAWGYLGQVRASLGQGDAAISAASQALLLMPASSRHHASLAMVYRLLDRRAEATKAAGMARALAKTPGEREQAQNLLAAIAKDALSAPPPMREVSTTDRTEPSGANTAMPAPTTGSLAPAPVATGSADAAAPASPPRFRSEPIAHLIDTCFSDNETCRKALPSIAGDCNDGASLTGPAACRNVGYILDVGLGMSAQPAGAADYYRKGCDRKDEVSCVRLATLRALGRGVPRDVPTAVRVLEAACKNDVQEGCFRLGVHLSSTKSAADLARAREVLDASCKADFAESCAWLKKLPPG